LNHVKVVKPKSSEIGFSIGNKGVSGIHMTHPFVSRANSFLYKLELFHSTNFVPGLGCLGTQWGVYHAATIT